VLLFCIAVKAGWGDWAGPGAGGMQISQKVLNKRDRLLTKVQQENAVKVLGRADHKMAGVMISNRRVKTASKYKITELPHPFTSVEEYERSLQMPLGGTSLVWVLVRL
jgi:U3 small nucleolar RNA-associated protein 14